MAVFERDGFVRLEAAISPTLCDDLDRFIGDMADAGRRNLIGRSMRDWIDRFGRIATLVLGKPAFAVRCFALEKSVKKNWALPWHQDVTVAVVGREELPGFGPWSLKDGVLHVAAPASPGSHRLGIIPAKTALRTAERLGPYTCTCARGDIIVARPLLLHSSGKSRTEHRRRILHIEYATEPLPAPLQWAFSA